MENGILWAAGGSFVFLSIESTDEQRQSIRERCITKSPTLLQNTRVLFAAELWCKPNDICLCLYFRINIEFIIRRSGLPEIYVGIEEISWVLHRKKPTNHSSFAADGPAECAHEPRIQLNKLIKFQRHTFSSESMLEKEKHTVRPIEIVTWLFQNTDHLALEIVYHSLKFSLF